MAISSSTSELEPNTPKPDKDESEDFVEHLRTVHFALITTCLALFVIVLGSSSDKLKNVFQQLDTVSETAAAATHIDWISDEATDFVKHSQRCLEFYSERGRPRGFLGEQNPPFRILPLDEDGKILIKNERLVWERSVSTGINTLSDFRHYWDAQFKIVCPVELSDREAPIRHVLGQSSFSLPNGFEEIDPTDPQNEAVASEFVYAYSDKSKGTPVLVIRDVTRTDSKTILVRDAIRRHFPEKHLPYRRFKDAFYDLDQATAGVQEDANFPLIRRILELQQKNSTDVFEAFGQKFPTDSATRWGVLIVVGVQFYLLLHFSEYRRRHVGKTNTAWIGLYDSRSARFLFCATALVAPIGVITFVCIKAGLLPRMPIRNFLLCAVSVVVSVFFSFVMSREYFRMHAGDTLK